MTEGEVHEVNIVLKADVQGSVEAISDSLLKLSTDDDVNEVRNGMECGIGVKNYNDVRVGDMIEVFEIIEIQRSID